MNRFILDFEFSGLPRYEFVPEITQMKIENVDTGECLCKNFASKPTNFKRDFYGKLEGSVPFDKTQFLLCLSVLGGTPDDEFYGFSIDTDKALLAKADICLTHYHDIQWDMRMMPKYERDMAYGGSSLEYCYYLVSGSIVKDGDHNGAGELRYIKSIYDAVYCSGDERRSYLTMYPWGDEGGMPLDVFVASNFRRADGYRYHNDNPLAAAFTALIDGAKDEDEDDEQEYFG